MKKKYFLVLAAFLISGCSQIGSDVSSQKSISDVDLDLAQHRLSFCSRNIVANWLFKDSAALGQDYSGNNFDASVEYGAPKIKDSSCVFDGASGLSVSATDSFKQNNFALEMHFLPENLDTIMTLASFGADENGGAWMLRLEKNQLVVLIKNGSSCDSWQSFYVEKRIKNQLWNLVRMERIDSLITVYIEDSLCMGIELPFDLNIDGNLKIGFDPSNCSQLNSFKGKMDFVRFEKIDDLKNESVVKDKENDTGWIAAWEFNNPYNFGFDFTGNGHNAVLGEGTITGDSGHIILDGASGIRVNLDPEFQINEFVVETRIYPTFFGSIDNILTAEPPGRYVDGWVLRIENGMLKFWIRDVVDGMEWNEFKVKALSLNEWYDIRVERSVDSIRVILNDTVAVNTPFRGDVSQLNYDWGIGYDAMNQNDHDRYFTGKMDFVRFGKFTKFTPAKIIERDTTSKIIGSDTIVSDGFLVAWEFNDSSNVGFDFTNNGNNAVVGDGNPFIQDSVLVLDGASGLYLPKDKIWKLNEFAVETRIYPTVFGNLDNIFSTEPPGCCVDGWVLRIENGILKFWARDESMGRDWNGWDIKALSLNQWYTIRVERSVDSIRVILNDTVAFNVQFSGDMGQMLYDWGLGYDAMNQNDHDRYFTGKIDYIRFGLLNKRAVAVEPVVNVSNFNTLLAAWEFNDSSNVGFDFTNNGNNAVVGDGNPFIQDSVLVLDGASGLYLPKEKTWKTNEFAIETRIYPMSFGNSDNIFTNEPIGSNEDGWALRIENGMLKFWIRGFVDCTEWNVLNVGTLSLNEWYDIRVERSANFIKVILNDTIETSVPLYGDLAQVRYDWGIGYGVMDQIDHDSYFTGKIDYIRFYGL